MSTLTRTQHHVDGTITTHSRSTPHGRRPTLPELRRTATIIIHVTEQEKAAFLQAQQISGFTQSTFGSIFLAAGIRQFIESNNCSTQ